MSLYDSCHDVSCRFSGNDKVSTLRITIEERRCIATNKVYSIKITDDDDPGFLYSLILNEEDYMRLKNEQNLRSEFDYFPKHLSQFFSFCENPNKPFRLVLDEIDRTAAFQSRGVVYLKIIESSDFRDTCLLSLSVAHGTEEDVRLHLCAKINRLQEQLTLALTESNCLRMNLADKNNQLEESNNKLMESRHKWTVEMDHLRKERDEQLALERNKLERCQKESESEHKSLVDKLRNDLELCNFKYNASLTTKTDLANNNRTLTDKLHTIERRLEDVSRNCEELTSRNEVLEQKVVQSERLMAVKERHIASLHVENNKLKNAEAQLERLLHIVQQLKNELRTSSDKVKNLQSENNRMDQKFKVFSKTVERVECENHNTKKLLEEKGLSAIALERELNDKEEALKNALSKLDDLQNQVGGLEKELKKQVDINSFLHRKLSQQGTGKENALIATSDAVLTNTSRVNFSAQTANRTFPSYL